MTTLLFNNFQMLLMKKSLILFMLLMPLSLFASCSSWGRSRNCDLEIAPDSVIYSSLGKSLSETLFNPDKVLCYTLKGKGEVSKEDIQIEPHYVRDSLIAELPSQFYGILQFNLIADTANYKRDTIIVRSPYVPLLEFAFVRKKQVAHVVISLSDFTWSVVYDDKKQFNWNYEDKKMMYRFCSLFLNKKND